MGNSINTCLCEIRRPANTIRQEDFPNETPTKHASNMIQISFGTMSKDVLSLLRKKKANATQFLTGHGQINKHCSHRLETQQMLTGLEPHFRMSLKAVSGSDSLTLKEHN